MNLESLKSHRVKMIFQFSIPSIIAMVLTSLITVVDGLFIGNYVGGDGIAAVNLGLPIIYLYLGIGLMISVGGVALAGMAFGAGDIDKCNHVFNQTVCTTVVASALLTFVMWVCLDPMLQRLNANPQVATHFKNYYSVMLFQLPIMIINASFGMFIRSEGEPAYFMKVNILNVLLNTLLDFIFVKWLYQGVTGVAVASLISGVVSLLCILYYFIKKSKVYKLGKFRYSSTVWKSTVFNGSSEFIGEMSLCISIFAYNFVILKYIGVHGVTAFAIAGYISYIFSMIILGFGQGVVPLLSFSYGAKEYSLASNIRKTTNMIVLIVGAAVLLLVLLSSGWYSQLFVRDEQIKQMIRSGLVIFSVSFLFSGVNTITSFYFTSIGKAKESAMISSARGLFFLLICIFTLPSILGMNGVWLVAPVTEGITLLITFFYIYKEKVKEREGGFAL
ncbi:MATE family efflux transporter [Anaerotignum sp. MB30-C6]|uniref:MATE family efflux transporter n=1 Tax=Anaerotignum sp. MB30-C6 TaxID=3070814 RepID=UPI0027DB4C4E|nr:MATE family efflux transporter [Anaerotignum sp. MB30-C6]WMI79969.1 MATE family efflux transporter [Anaerotignum sp. MB30-C6]